MVRKKLIFVCLSEMNRSPTAKRVFRSLLKRDGLYSKYSVDSAGLLEGRRLTKKDVDDAYLVIAFDGMVASALEKTFEVVRLQNLQIPDVYEKDDRELVAKIKAYYDSGDWK